MSIGGFLDSLRSFRDRNGFDVGREALSWRVHGVRNSSGVLFNFDFLENVGNDDAASFIRYVRHRIMTGSAAHARNCYAHVKAYLSSICYVNNDSPWEAINAWKRELRERGLEYTLHYVRDWFLWSTDQNLEGFDDADIYWSLRNLHIPGNAKGIAVLSEDPDQGPLFHVEEALLRGALARTPTLLSPEETLLIWLFFSHGFNCANVALLRKEDFSCLDIAGQQFYELRVPRVKKRNRDRAEFKTRRLDPFLGKLIEAHIQNNLQKFGAREGPRPLFWSYYPRRMNNEFANHASSAQMGAVVTAAVRRLGLVSPVTNRQLRVTCRRLRYSFASRMVHQGATVEELVDLLDHTDDQHVLVYFKNRSAQEKIDAATAVAYGPVVDRFMGRLVDNETTARGHAGNRIKSSVNLLDLGTCSLGTECDKYPPRACYVCPKFLAWKEAPHDRFLDELITANRADARGSVQLDDVVLAVGQVVAACKR